MRRSVQRRRPLSPWESYVSRRWVGGARRRLPRPELEGKKSASSMSSTIRYPIQHPQAAKRATGGSQKSHTFLGNVLRARHAGELSLEARVFGLASPFLAALFRGLRRAGGDLAGRIALRRIIRARWLRRRVPPSLAASGTAAESERRRGS